MMADSLQYGLSITALTIRAACACPRRGVAELRCSLSGPVAVRRDGLMWDQGPRFDICRVGVVYDERGVNHVAVRSHPAVPHQKSIRIELGPNLGGGIGPDGRARAHQPEVVQERPAEGR